MCDSCHPLSNTVPDFVGNDQVGYWSHHSVKAGWRQADVAQLVERNLAKVEVASSSLVVRSEKGPGLRTGALRVSGEIHGRASTDAHPRMTFVISTDDAPHCSKRPHGGNLDVMDAIEVEGLKRRYAAGKSGAFEAVRDISFSVREGEIFALLGTNGAGKTSTVEVLEGLARASAGSVRVLGLDPFTQRAYVRPRTGVMLQEGASPPS